MQIKKEEVKNRIVFSAKELFKDHGFRNTSIRQVAKTSQVSTANIYNYFKNKDELFEYIIKEALETYEKFILDAYSKGLWKDKKSWTLESELERFNEFIDNIYEHEDEFMLLFLKSEGSKFENYKMKMVEKHCELSQEVNEYMYKNEKDFLKKKVPKFIVRNSVKMYMEIIIEGLNTGIDKSEMKNRIEEYMYFLFYGYTGYFSNKLCKK